MESLVRMNDGELKLKELMSKNLLVLSYYSNLGINSYIRISVCGISPKSKWLVDFVRCYHEW